MGNCGQEAKRWRIRPPLRHHAHDATSAAASSDFDGYGGAVVAASMARRRRCYISGLYPQRRYIAKQNTAVTCMHSLSVRIRSAYQTKGGGSCWIAEETRAAVGCGACPMAP
uniref:Uncharacterized protein n=1 Tax=Oryza nivara TaxID=4536 RepID=A0A0E0G007_ORYNI